MAIAMSKVTACGMLAATAATTAATTATLILAGSLLATPAWAQNYPITAGQKATADQVAQAGVPLSELSVDAPDNYAVKSGDTLWGISGLFLDRKSVV